MSHILTQEQMRSHETKWAQWCGGLKPIRSNSRWVLFATDRNAITGVDLHSNAGLHGVRRGELAELIWITLNRAYAFLVGQGRTPFPADITNVHIYLFAVDDADNGCGGPLTMQLLFASPTRTTSEPLRIGTVMALPSRNCEPTWDLEVGQTLSSAVHEVSHCLNLQDLPLRKYPSETDENRDQWIESWRWLDEGMAVAAEAEFFFDEQNRQYSESEKPLPLTPDWLRFALDWVDRPDRSLDDPKSVYQSGFFVRFVSRLLGSPSFMNGVWKLSMRVWEHSPCRDHSALYQLVESFSKLSPPRIFSSATLPDVFASGYCFESYFLNDPSSMAFEPEVYGRFRERAVTRSWQFDHVAELSVESSENYDLHGLSCRYFRFFPSRNELRLTIRVQPVEGMPSTSFQNIKAEVALTDPETGMCQRNSVKIPIRFILQGEQDLVCQIETFSRRTCGHAVLIVTNCAYMTTTKFGGYNQKAFFKIAVSALP